MPVMQLKQFRSVNSKQEARPHAHTHTAVLLPALSEAVASGRMVLSTGTDSTRDRIGCSWESEGRREFPSAKQGAASALAYIAAKDTNRGKERTGSYGGSNNTAGAALFGIYPAASSQPFLLRSSPFGVERLERRSAV
jgi:hypothetical protein